ncbi:MAG: hypothetical protein RML45_08510 [Acetobacteraceae bacterium]|nr:hypothetical protein [Acetobacteraceae bacterium]
MRSIRLLLAVLTVSAALPAAAQAPQRPVQPAPAQREAPQVTVRNEGEITLYELYIARSGGGVRNWGPDRLGDRVLEAGREFAVRLGPNFGCLADIRLVYEDGEAEIRERVDLCRERVVVAARFAPMEERRFTLRNRTGLVVIQVFGRSAGEREWGPDRLGNDVLEDGAEMTIAIPSRGCEIDLMVVYVENRAVEERRRLDACDLAELILAPGWLYADNLARIPPRRRPVPGPRVRLVNRSGRTVFTLHVFPDGAADEGPDRLGAGTLSDGAALDLALDPAAGCRYTLRLTYGDGTREERAGIDFCRLRELTIAPGWLDIAPGRRALRQRGPPCRSSRSTSTSRALRPARMSSATASSAAATAGDRSPLPDPDRSVPTRSAPIFRDGRTAVVPLTDLCAVTEIVLSP